MKFTFTDGLNIFSAIEYEKLSDFDQFLIGQKLTLIPQIEVRRGILMLKKQNVKQLGDPPAIQPPQNNSNKNTGKPNEGKPFQG